MVVPRAHSEPEDAIREVAKTIMEKEQQRGDNDSPATESSDSAHKQQEPEWVDVMLDEASRDEDLAETIKG